MDRLPLRSHRRRRNLPHAAGRHGQGSPHHHRRFDAPLAARLVARQQEAPLRRQIAAPLLRRHRRKEARADRSGQVRRSHRLHLVARQQMGRLRQAAENSNPRNLSLLAGRQKNHSGDHRFQRQRQSRLRSRRQISLLPLRPRLTTKCSAFTISNSRIRRPFASTPSRCAPTRLRRSLRKATKSISSQKSNPGREGRSQARRQRSQREKARREESRRQRTKRSRKRKRSRSASISTAFRTASSPFPLLRR